MEVAVCVPAGHSPKCIAAMTTPSLFHSAPQQPGHRQKEEKKKKKKKRGSRPKSGQELFPKYIEQDAKQGP